MAEKGQRNKIAKHGKEMLLQPSHMSISVTNQHNRTGDIAIQVTGHMDHATYLRLTQRTVHAKVVCGLCKSRYQQARKRYQGILGRAKKVPAYIDETPKRTKVETSYTVGLTDSSTTGTGES